MKDGRLTNLQERKLQAGGALHAPLRDKGGGCFFLFNPQGTWQSWEPNESDGRVLTEHLADAHLSELFWAEL